MLEEKTVLGDENYSVIREGLLTWDEETKRRLRGYNVSIPSGCNIHVAAVLHEIS